jgi:hypothetical protein
VADHDAIAEKVDQLNLNSRKRLRAVLWATSFQLIPENSSSLLVMLMGSGVAHKSVEDGFTLIVDNRDAAEDLRTCIILDTSRH